MNKVNGEKQDLYEELSIDQIDEMEDFEFSNCLSSLFDEPALDLIINLLAENYDRLKSKLRTTPDYLEQTELVNELHITKTELVRFRRAKSFNPELVVHHNNT